MSMKPNETCEDFYCRQRQKEQQELQAQFPIEVEPVPVEESVVHEDNEWGISLVDESTPVETDRSKVEIAPGISTAYELPVDDDEPQVEVGAIDTSMSLEELMAQMKAI